MFEFIGNDKAWAIITAAGINLVIFLITYIWLLATFICTIWVVFVTYKTLKQYGPPRPRHLLEFVGVIVTLGIAPIIPGYLAGTFVFG